VRAGDRSDTSVVAAIDPQKQITGAQGGELTAVAAEVAQRLWRVLLAVGPAPERETLDYPREADSIA
jgi:hypothetical protein